MEKEIREARKKRKHKVLLSELIPTNWLDPLLTGKSAVIGSSPYNSKDIERLLTALKMRLQKQEKYNTQNR